MKGAGWMASCVLDQPLQVAGKRLAEYVEDFKLRNVKDYLRRAEYKLTEPPAEGSRIHDRVLIGVTEAASSDDTLMAEYFGGILASAFNPDDRDDRGVAWTALVSRLSAYEIHLHYLVYDAWRRLLAGSQIDLSMDEGRSKADLWVPVRDLLQVMGSSGLDAIGQVAVGLIAESLLGNPFVFGDGESVPKLRGKSVGYGLFGLFAVDGEWGVS